MEDILKKFEKADTSDFPDFHNYEKLYEMALWVLWIAKEKFGIKKLTAEQISSVIRDVYEVSVETKSIINSFNRLKGNKIHLHKKNGLLEFEIMKNGKDYLISHMKETPVDLFYFEPGNKYKSQKILSEDIFSQLKGELKIVDPYCDKRTLDILENAGTNNVKFLTQLKNIHDGRKKRSFIREVRAFQSAYPNFEFKDYQNNDIHDRYIISDDSIVIVGYSLKDFGKKETFAVILDKNMDIHNQLIKNFDDKWNNSSSII